MRIMLSIVAVIVAVAGAFATTLQPKGVIHAYINTTPDPNVCEEVSVACEGGPQDCTKFVPELGRNEAIWDLQPTGCQIRLSMQ